MMLHPPSIITRANLPGSPQQTCTYPSLGACHVAAVSCKRGPEYAYIGTLHPKSEC